MNFIKLLLFTLIQIHLVAAAIPHLKTCKIAHNEEFYKGCMSGYMKALNDDVSHLNEAIVYCKEKINY